MLFYWQQPATKDFAKAATCLDPRGRTVAELRALAKQAKDLYDTRGLFVVMDKLSDQPDFRNEEGRPVVVVHRGLPEVVIERGADGRWLWTSASLSAIGELYSEELGLFAGAVPRMPDVVREEVLGVQIWQYLAFALLVLLGLVLRAIVRVIIANRFRKVLDVVGQDWASDLAGLAASPLSTLAMALAFRVAYPLLMLPVSVALVLSVAVRVLMVLAIVWGLYRLVDLVAGRMAIRAQETDSKLDDQLVPLVRKSLKLLVVLGGALFVLQNLEVDVGSLLTGLGIGGLAFAFAAKETLANFFGSLMIFTDRPFQIGDWIVVEGAEGIVEEVGFRSTRIRTFYNSLITVPNATFTDAQIDNYGQREYRRTFTTLNLTYDTTPEQMQAFCEGIRAIIMANRTTRKDYYEVHMSGFGAHSLDVMVYFFFKVPGWSDELRERHNVYLEIMRLAQQLGVVFAFPTQTLHLDSVQAPGVQRRVAVPKSAPDLARIVEAFGPRGDLARPTGPKLVNGAFLSGSRAVGGDEAD
jgi:MscS family membrane protein